MVLPLQQLACAVFGVDGNYVLGEKVRNRYERGMEIMMTTGVKKEGI